MKGLMYLAMEFRLCPVKRWWPGEYFEPRNAYSGECFGEVTLVTGWRMA